MVDNKSNVRDKSIRLGIKANLGQVLILVLVTAFIGSMFGMEQTVVPLIGANEYNIRSNALYHHLS